MMASNSNSKLKLAVYKFTSDDGCQLAFLNAGEKLLELMNLVEIVHFVQAGIVNFEAPANVAFIEGSISTPEEQIRIKKIREMCQYVITIGACATAGGIQALRNFANYDEWLKSIYAKPEFIKSLATSTPISNHIKVDLEIWGCPVNTEQVITAIHSLSLGVMPNISHESVCLECKRKANVCVLVAKKLPCMGPVTQMGCGALCPSVGRACYQCYGPSQNPNTHSLGKWFQKMDLSNEAISRQFLHINNQAPVFKEAGQYFKGIKIIEDKSIGKV